MLPQPDDTLAYPQKIQPRDEGEETREVTGRDAQVDEADMGSAGSGASFFGGDRSGGGPVGIEGAPDEPRDISFDEIRRMEGASDEEEEDEREITARPKDLHAMDAGEMG